MYLCIYYLSRLFNTGTMENPTVLFLKKWFSKTNITYISLMKIMVPALILIKILEELGFVTWLSKILGPVMGFIGLPGEAGLVWATTLLTGLYTGLIVFFTQIEFSTFSIMQASILGSLMLFGHALIVEGAIAKKVGVDWLLTFLLRIGGAFIFGLLVHKTCNYFNLFQEKVRFDYIPAIEAGSSLTDWIIEQLYSFVIIYLIIAVLILLLEGMDKVGINKFIQKLLAPVLGAIGIGKAATSLTLIGMTIGLSFGGGLLIQESKNEAMSKKDIFLSMCFISMFHSIIEDTILILLMGTSFWIIVVFRLIYVLIIMFVIHKSMRRRRLQPTR